MRVDQRERADLNVGGIKVVVDFDSIRPRCVDVNVNIACGGDLIADADTRAGGGGGAGTLVWALDWLDRDRSCIIVC